MRAALSGRRVELIVIRTVVAQLRGEVVARPVQRTFACRALRGRRRGDHNPIGELMDGPAALLATNWTGANG